MEDACRELHTRFIDPTIKRLKNKKSVDSRHGVKQGHVFGAIERQPLSAVVMHHLRDAGKHTAALVQRESVFFSLSHDDVNAALTRPETQRRKMILLLL